MNELSESSSYYLFLAQTLNHGSRKSKKYLLWTHHEIKHLFVITKRFITSKPKASYIPVIYFSCKLLIMVRKNWEKRFR